MPTTAYLPPHIIDAVLRNQPIFGPCHELAQGIDLVVVLDIREGEHLCAQLVQPRGILFQQHLASFQGGSVHAHAHHIVALGLDGPHGIAVPLEGLLQGGARGLVLDKAR